MIILMDTIHHTNWCFIRHGPLMRNMAGYSSFKKDKKFFSIEGGYCVMSEEGYKETDWNELVEISQEEALNLILE